MAVQPAQNVRKTRKFQGPKYSKYIVVTDPIISPAVRQTDYPIYSTTISPQVVFSASDQTNPFRNYVKDYEKYSLSQTKVRLVALTSAAAVMGYEMSMVWFPDASESPTSLQMTNLKQQGRFHKTVPPGTHMEFIVPATQKPLYVDCADKQPQEAFNGIFIVVIHGAPYSAYTNTLYTGPLFRIEHEFLVHTTGYSPGNISANLPQALIEQDLQISSEGGNAIIHSTALTAFANSLQNQESNSSSILSVVLAAGDTIAGALPFPLNILGKVGMFFLRRFTAANGSTSFLIYKDYQSAISNRPVKFLGRCNVPGGSIRIAAITNPPVTSAVTPAAPLNFQNLVQNGMYKVTCTATTQSQVSFNWPVMNVDLNRMEDLSTGAFSNIVPTGPNWRVSGQTLTAGAAYGYNTLGAGELTGIPSELGYRRLSWNSDNNKWILLSRAPGTATLPQGVYTFVVTLDLLLQ